jgi:hypothetical protein
VNVRRKVSGDVSGGVSCVVKCDGGGAEVTQPLYTRKSESGASVAPSRTKLIANQFRGW